MPNPCGGRVHRSLTTEPSGVSGMITIVFPDAFVSHGKLTKVQGPKLLNGPFLEHVIVTGLLA